MQNYYIYYVRGYYTGVINGYLKLDELEMVAFSHVSEAQIFTGREYSFRIRHDMFEIRALTVVLLGAHTPLRLAKVHAVASKSVSLNSVGRA
jgi:hypothetical protein